VGSTPSAYQDRDRASALLLRPSHRRRRSRAGAALPPGEGASPQPISPRLGNRPRPRGACRHAGSSKGDDLTRIRTRPTRGGDRRPAARRRRSLRTCSRYDRLRGGSLRRAARAPRPDASGPTVHAHPRDLCGGGVGQAAAAEAARSPSGHRAWARRESREHRAPRVGVTSTTRCPLSCSSSTASSPRPWFSPARARRSGSGRQAASRRPPSISCSWHDSRRAPKTGEQ
jgi:hypothetical protein